ncbi:dual specificity calcium/calmodulin-dependent 3',5'-cyclic nucleotide phosphodiesterase 1A isoform X2 [Anolis carolinensis]|uniref:dual specificity calcium/calmodulin-dependent 3',5'-cyclic nucleotide phosphodiesterase 1A isoform X2 n=1 Tax=Anolis carolinensis TaxID=28377 RepID=UPI002F2B2FB0
MTQDKREKTGVRTSSSSAKSKTSMQRNKKKLSSNILCLLNSEDEMSKIQWDSMPVDVQEWLTITFTSQQEAHKAEDAASVRTVAYAVQTGVFVERKFHTATSPVGLAYPLEVTEALKIPIACLISFTSALEAGYNKYQNTYHNSVHATDVTQTVHTILLHTGIMHWFTDLEILAFIFGTSIHDYDHPGTTNHFHVATRSETAILYNDKSVLENHHVSAVYHLMQSDEMNILVNLTAEEWRELRHLVIEMILATDMTQHFHHMNCMKRILQNEQQVKRIHKDKVMAMIVHAADISHPAKPWHLHQKWSEAVMEEFFNQGDKEAALGLPISSLCDRKTINIAESQIGFLDIIIKPFFVLLLELIEEIVAPLIKEASKSKCASSSKQQRRNQYTSESRSENGDTDNPETGTSTERQLLSALDISRFKEHLLMFIQENKEKWKEIQEKNSEEQKKQLPELKGQVAESETKDGDKGTREESMETECKKAKDQGRKGKAERGKSQKASKGKNYSSKSKSYCATPEKPPLCYCQFPDSRAFEPIDVSFIVYNADASELSQSHLDDVMEVTESYEELVDNPSSWRKAASKPVSENIEEMRRMVPETKPLSPNESDDVVIEECISDESQSLITSVSSDPAAQKDDQQPPKISFLPTELTQSDMEIFSLWNEEVLRRAAEQKKQDQTGMPTDEKKEPITGQPSEGSQGSEGISSGNDNFVLQIVSFDSVPVTCSRETGPRKDPGQQEDNTAPAPMNENTTPSSGYEHSEIVLHGAAAVSVTSLNYGFGVFRIPP